MSKELSPKYNPAEVEAGRYQKWLDADVFKPSGDQKAKPYSIVIPPPNVTGKLHLGHAWDTTLQDIIIRQKRMQGFDTLWLPGMDHAGIATQAKVEERLRGEGISRYDLGRESFLTKVWEWKDEYATTIKEQWGKMGLSVDYSRERFTLDEGLSKAVRKVFVELYKKGWIYRGEFIINWDPAARTALSDIEVIHKDVEGAFYHMNYMLEDGSRALEVATTRPETMFGDVAVAVNPEDPRYKDLIGKNVILPIANKLIPIVGDEHADPEFGTGVVKITPAHDPNDFLVGQRHNLPQVNVMNDDGTMNDLAFEFAGMDRFEARKAVVAKLEEIGALVKIEKRVHSVGHSERTGVVVEPRLSTQWFVKMDQLAKNAIANQDTDDKVKFCAEGHCYLGVEPLENDYMKSSSFADPYTYQFFEILYEKDGNYVLNHIAYPDDYLLKVKGNDKAIYLGEKGIFRTKKPEKIQRLLTKYLNCPSMDPTKYNTFTKEGLIEVIQDYQKNCQ